ncbi:MAG: SHOCT domain-containing protein [Deltaproteobacteria bacterium]|nr:SHOCT domain-containing protein [Deltaproteobacteria bacterium]
MVRHDHFLCYFSTLVSEYLEKLNKLKADGILTQEEYDAQKQKLLQK